MAISFFSLPLELRDEIYSNLLVSSMQPVVIYKDKAISREKLDIHAAILRLSRRVYSEAFHFLYERNHFLIDLRSPRAQNVPEVLVCVTGFVSLFTDKEDLSICQLGYERQTGTISRDSLRTMRHIEIATSYDAVWPLVESFTRPSYEIFGQTGLILLRVLDALGNEIANDTSALRPGTDANGKPTLKLTIERDLPDGRTLFDSKGKGPRGDEAQPMRSWKANRVAYCLYSRRDVEVREWRRVEDLEMEAFSQSAKKRSPLKKKVERVGVDREWTLVKTEADIANMFC